MTRRYLINAIDDSRDFYTTSIRQKFSDWVEIPCEAVNGYNIEELDLNIKKHNIPIHIRNMPVGELGVWMSNLNAWNLVGDEPLFVVEDDAVVYDNFYHRFEELVNELPSGWDFLSLYVPHDEAGYGIFKKIDPASVDIGSSLVCKVYQTYGGQSVFYSPTGAKKIYSLAIENGIDMQFDEFLYHQAKLGKLNGYTTYPTIPDLIHIDGKAESLAHSEIRYYK